MSRQYLVTFDVSNSSELRREIKRRGYCKLFAFKWVPKDDESACTSSGTMTVCAATHLFDVWRLDPDQSAERLLYCHAKEELPKLIEQVKSGGNNYLTRDIVPNPIPNNCPYDLGRVAFPPSKSFCVEVSEKIGF